MKKLTSLILITILVVGLFTGTVGAEKTVKAETGTMEDASYLAFTSDVHGKIDNLSAYVNALAKDQIPVEQFAFGGDMSDSFTATDYISAKQVVSTVFPLAGTLFTMGNHEWNGGDESQFTTTTGATRVGWLTQNDKYQMFAFGPAGSSQTFTSSDIASLKEALAACDTSKPMFIVSHFPLHVFSGTMGHSGKSKTRVTKNAVQVINLLNQYPNVVFLWGHNHTLKDTAYGTVKQSGDKIKYSASASKKIWFTYASMGCMKDGASSDNYGVVAKLFTNGADWYINYTYRNLTTSVKTIETGSRRLHTLALQNTKAVIAKKSLKKKKSISLKVKAPLGYNKVSSLSGISKTSTKVYYKVTFKSSKKRVATVTSKGKVKAKKKGTTVITTTITLNDSVTNSYKTKVTVK